MYCERSARMDTVAYQIGPDIYVEIRHRKGQRQVLIDAPREVAIKNVRPTPNRSALVPLTKRIKGQ